MAETDTPSFIISIRFLLAILAFIAYAVQYSQKINMSVAIVCMIKHKDTAHLNESIGNSSSNQAISDSVTCEAGISSKGKQFNGEFEWNKQLQGFILSTYFTGYLITEIPGARRVFKI